MLGGPQVRSGRVQRISSAPGFDPRTVEPERIAIPTAALSRTACKIQDVSEMEHSCFGLLLVGAYSFSLHLQQCLAVSIQTDVPDTGNVKNSCNAMNVNSISDCDRCTWILF